MEHFPLPRVPTPELEPIVQAWEISASLHRWTEGAADEAIDEAERVAETRFPRALRAIYQMSDGIELLEGNLQMEPLFPVGEETCLVNLSGKLREWGWPIPNEVLVFGGSVSDALFGLWLPKRSSGCRGCARRCNRRGLRAAMYGGRWDAVDPVPQGVDRLLPDAPG